MGFMAKAKWDAKVYGRWVSGVVRRWKREISENFRQHIYIYLKKHANLAADMEMGVGNLGTKK